MKPVLLSGDVLQLFHTAMRISIRTRNRIINHGSESVMPPVVLVTFQETLREFFRHVRLADIVDVLLISCFLYLIINWLSQSVSWKTLLSVAVLVAIYFLARLFELYLTTMLLEGLFFVILVGIIIVFQTDMRRFIDRIGTWDFFTNRPSHPSSALTIDSITEAASTMADMKTGALIAIRGNESWERHIHGGVSLDGTVSLPLLRSIFDTSTPGHDGAVLVEGDKVVKFGVHLPLSVRLGKIGSGGTRHAAALGFSERCDALLVVVSEERGIISIAQGGVIEALSSSGELRNRLDAFWQKYYTDQKKPGLPWWKRRSLRIALVSVALAIIFWFAFAYQSGTIYRTFTVPIEFKNLQTGRVSLPDSTPVRAQIILSGSQQAFQMLDPSGLIISLDLSKARPDVHKLPISRKNINLPDNLDLYGVSPSAIPVQPKNYVTKSVPVKPDTTGRLPGHLSLVSITSDPAEIRIRIPRDSSAVITSIKTSPIDLSGITKTSREKVTLRFPDVVQRLDGQPQKATVTIRVK